MGVVTCQSVGPLTAPADTGTVPLHLAAGGRSGYRPPSAAERAATPPPRGCVQLTVHLKIQHTADCLHVLYTDRNTRIL